MAVEIEQIESKQAEGWLEEDYKPGLIHQAVVTYQANSRAGLAHTRNRSAVAGVNKKPWRQKGTGRARHGSQITPLWVGGGQAHGPTGEQDFSKKLTKKMKRTALMSALTKRFEEGGIYVMTVPDLDEPSTSRMHEFFGENDLAGQKMLLLLDGEDNVRLSTRNLPYCQPFDAASLNAFQIVSNPVLVFTEAGLEKARERFNNEL